MKLDWFALSALVIFWLITVLHLLKQWSQILKQSIAVEYIVDNTNDPYNYRVIISNILIMLYTNRPFSSLIALTLLLLLSCLVMFRL